MTIQNATDNLDEIAEALGQTIFEDFNEGYYIGMMSGTSLDGLDAVVVRFNNDEANQNSNPLELVATHSKDFAPNLHSVLTALCQPNGIANLTINLDDKDEGLADGLTSELDWFGWASKEYAEFASTVVNELLENAKIDADDVLAIGCHGQTVRHRPQHGFSLQLVDANIIAERTGISTVTDFRRRDMAVGGQGAPLVPAFHQAMFANPKQMRVLLNLGGIANISVLPPTNGDNANNITGYDTGPANLLLDAWTNLHTNKPYDEGGNFAKSGEVIEALLTQLLKHPYFAMPSPKSTGREDFNLAWLEAQIADFAHHNPSLRYSPADVQATLTEFTAVTASNEITKFEFASNTANANHLYVCGGGAFNSHLLERLTKHLPNWQVTTTSELGLAPTWMEATAFAWLARQTLMGEVGNCPAVTGANKGVVLGQVCFA
ncbi:anhydro-N-acetylmuramic acid kinase [Psychrobacter sp. HD31]|uniref:anhydro-N-acetylmuramic acid kinase n=1 Tax=Psychrobacter sp. HD31 TaxID=3112003 RepID=UPI003DA525E4